jgi:hypothetical protein
VPIALCSIIFWLAMPHRPLPLRDTRYAVLSRMVNAVGNALLMYALILLFVPYVIATMLSKWLAGLAGNHDDDDAIRGRRASANRVLTILRAALNQAFRDGKVTSDVAWRTVKPSQSPFAPTPKICTGARIHRIVATNDPTVTHSCL